MSNVVDHAAELRKGADAIAPHNKLIADKMRAAADFIDDLLRMEKSSEKVA
jgi:hypothetical protein